MALSVIYKDDVWDFDTYPRRLYKEDNAAIEGQVVKTFEDMTPYTQRGSYVTGGLLSEITQSLKGFVASSVTVSADGNTITEISDSGTLVTVRSVDGLNVTSTFTDFNGNVIVKDTTMSQDGMALTNTVNITPAS